MNWISVKERLPKDGVTVLVRTTYGLVAAALHDTYLHEREEGDNSFDDSEVTHWMPLPEPPKEDE